MPPSSRYKRYLLRIFLIAAVLSGLGAYLFHAIRYQHLHVPIINWFTNQEQNHHVWNQPHHRAESVNVQDYTLAYFRTLNSIEDNLSGLSYWDERDELLAVLNRPPTILTLNSKGDITAQYPLQGISDTEGIAYLANGQVVLSNEKHGQIVLAHLPEQPSTIDLSKAPRLSLGPPDAQNSGLEGVGYDHVRDQLYVVKEHSPKALYRVNGLCSAKPSCSFEGTTLEDLSHWLAPLDFIHDLSSVVIDPELGHVILLSEQNQSLVELDETGQPRSTRPLKQLSTDMYIPQAEGLTLAPNGNLYLVSEPNLFYVFTR